MRSSVSCTGCFTGRSASPPASAAPPAVGLVLLWIPPVVAVGAGNAYSPQPIRPIVWWGEVWLAVIFYLLIGLAVLGVGFAVARLLKFRHRRELIQVASGVLVNAQQPDVVVLPGDLLDSAVAHVGPDLDAALAGQQPGRFTMLIAHQPLQGAGANERGVDLQLSGHTHGGQMWPLRYPVGWINDTVAGASRIGDLQLYTTRGIGAWGPPVRVGAPPDITVVTLRAH